MYSHSHRVGTNQNPAGPWVAGLVEYLNNLASNGWTIYYVNFMFEPIEGSMPQKIDAMKKVITKFYRRLATEFVRDGRSPKHQHKMPKLWLFIDRPGAKRGTQTFREIKFNAGVHFNGVFAFPPFSLFSGGFEQLIDDNSWLLQKRGSRIDVRPVDGQFRKISEYATKTIATGMGSADDTLILPETISQLSSKPRPMDAATRRIKQIQSELNVSDEVAKRMMERQDVKMS